MDRKSKLAQPEHHKYKVNRDKFHGLSRIPLKVANSEKTIKIVKKKDKNANKIF